MIYYYSFIANGLYCGSSFDATDDLSAIQKVCNFSKCLNICHILAIYTAGEVKNKFRTVWKKQGYRPEWEKPVHNIYKDLPSLGSNYTGTYSYPNGGSVEFTDSQQPTIVRYGNGEWIRIIDGEVVEIHTIETIEEHARDFAMKAHGEQMYGEKPYIVHLKAVHDVLVDFEFSGLLLIASWLHDVVEDTDVTIEDIEKNFGAVVAEYVQCCTGVGANRHARNDNMYDKFTKNSRGLPLKLADRIANIESAQKDNYSLLLMYRREHHTFTERLYPLRQDLQQMWGRLNRALWPTHA